VSQVEEKSKILIVDDIEEYLSSLKNVLRGEFSILTATSIAEAKEIINEEVDLLLLDIRLDEDDPQNRDGIHLLKWCKENYPTKPVVMMSAYRDFDMSVDALNLGASYFLKKPINIPELKALLRSLIEQARLSKENTQVKRG
jgi:DNA-binding NtrC family response regulator